MSSEISALLDLLVFALTAHLSKVSLSPAETPVNIVRLVIKLTLGIMKATTIGFHRLTEMASKLLKSLLQ